MTVEEDVLEAGSAISVEIGLDMSYLAAPGEKNLIHIPAVAGVLLLHWFLEGVVEGVGEAAGEDLERGVANATKRLGKRVRAVFDRKDRSLKADAELQGRLTTEATAAVENARAAVSTGDGARVARVADAYEMALVGYLSDEGMPARDALRIAQRVRAEAGVQLRPVTPQL